MLNNYKIENDNIEKIFSTSDTEYLIYIKKKNFKFFIVNRDMKIEREFNIAVGKKNDFLPKVYQGDDGTPEGIYYINEILSLDADKDSEAYKKLKRMNYIYFKAENDHYLWGHPDRDAGRNVYGPRFFRFNYPNKEDNKQYEKMKRNGLIPEDKDGQVRGQGTGLAIHGTNDPSSVGHRISSGCIRIHNKDVVLLDKYIQIRTPVYIER